MVASNELLLDCLLELIRKATLQTNRLIVSSDPECERESFGVGLVHGTKKLLRVDRSFLVRRRHGDRNQHIGTIAECWVQPNKGTKSVTAMTDKGSFSVTYRR